MTRRRALSRALLFAAALTTTGSAFGTPLDEPFVGGIGFSGPTTGDLSSVYWNPAALSSLTGAEFQMSGVLRTTTTSVDRAAVNATTGQPDPASRQRLDGSGTVWPKPWSPGPGWFAGVGANVLGRFTLAVAAYVPSYERVRYRATRSGDVPGGYHGVDVDLQNFALVPALAVRMGKYLHVGLAPGFLFSGGTLVFDEDTAINRGTPGLESDCGGSPCGFENPRAVARYRAGSSPFPASPAFTLGGGVHYHKDAWSVGIAYASRPLGNDGAGVRLDIRDGGITRAPGTEREARLCEAGHNGPCINGELSYGLPDAVMGGVTWNDKAKWEFTGIVRYQTFSQHDRMVLTLAGPAGSELGSAGLRSRMVLARGFQDRVDVRVRAVRTWGGWARGGAGLRVATPAVPARYLSPAAVDGLTFEPHVMGEVKLSRFLLRVGYALAFMPSRTADASAFDPGAAVACVDARYDLDQAACAAYRDGRARPTGAGSYTRLTHSLSFNLLARF